MWDLTVPGNNDHDFYVAVADTQVLVHNCDPDEPISAQVGAQREIRVAELTGGTVQGKAGDTGILITMPNVGTTDVDVIGPNGEYIAVGGPGKVLNLSRLGKSLKILRYAADQAGVAAQAWFAERTPESVLKVARRQLGSDNVFIFSATGRKA